MKLAVDNEDILVTLRFTTEVTTRNAKNNSKKRYFQCKWIINNT